MISTAAGCSKTSSSSGETCFPIMTRRSLRDSMRHHAVHPAGRSTLLLPEISGTRLCIFQRQPLFELAPITRSWNPCPFGLINCSRIGLENSLEPGSAVDRRVSQAKQRSTLIPFFTSFQIVPCNVKLRGLSAPPDLGGVLSLLLLLTEFSKSVCTTSAHIKSSKSGAQTLGIESIDGIMICRDEFNTDISAQLMRRCRIYINTTYSFPSPL